MNVCLNSSLYQTVHCLSLIFLYSSYYWRNSYIYYGELSYFLKLDPKILSRCTLQSVSCLLVLNNQHNLANTKHFDLQNSRNHTVTHNNSLFFFIIQSSVCPNFFKTLFHHDANFNCSTYAMLTNLKLLHSFGKTSDFRLCVYQ